MSATKRYFLFSGADYESSGGWRDFVDAFETVEQAESAVRSGLKDRPWNYEWWHIVDTTTLGIVITTLPDDKNTFGK